MNLFFSKRDAAIAGVIFAAVSLLFIRTARFEFINMDDSYYVLGHEVVGQGLTIEGIRYAFTSVSEGNYLPLTWLSHMLVVEIGGTGPAAHHVANVLLHGVTAALVYLFLKFATGAAGRSMAVALVWGVHPLRVESVAWVAERKDVLSGLFFVLALMAYVAYARRPSLLRYSAVTVAMVFGLLSKSIVVVLPCVLLLLDAWPLDRARLHEPGVIRRLTVLVAEKAPLFLLSLVTGVMAIVSQRAIGAMSSIEFVSLPHRIWNAFSSCVTYVLQVVWPFGLGIYYPYRDNQALYLWGVTGLCAIVSISALALWSYKSRPYLAVGWLWFLGVLAPVSGIMQAGLQAQADRYTYLPHIGLFVAAVWGLAGIVEQRPWATRWRVTAVAGLVLALCLLTWRQLGFWRTSETLFGHTLSVTGPNHFAEGNYGVALLDQGRADEAEKYFLRAIAIGPATHLDYHNLGASYLARGRYEEAKVSLETALRMNREYRASWVLLGDANLGVQNAQKSIEAYREASRLGEKSGYFHTNFGIALGMAGRLAEAEAEFRLALKVSPNYVPALFNLGVLATERGQTAQAREFFERALALWPDHEAARTALAALESR